MPRIQISSRNGDDPKPTPTEVNELLKRVKILGLNASWTDAESWESWTLGYLFVSAPKYGDGRWRSMGKSTPCRHAMYVVSVIVDEVLIAEEWTIPRATWRKRLNLVGGCNCRDFTYDEIMDLAHLVGDDSPDVDPEPGFETPDPDQPDAPERPFDPAPNTPILGWRAYSLPRTFQDLIENHSILQGGYGNHWSGPTFTATCEGCGLGARLDGTSRYGSHLELIHLPGLPSWLEYDAPTKQPPPTEPRSTATPDGLTPEQQCEWHLAHCYDALNADSCGVYMFQSLPELADQGYDGGIGGQLAHTQLRGRRHTNVIAQCVAYGVVVPFKKGYRASRIRVDAMWLPVNRTEIEEQDRFLARMLSDHYEAPCFPILHEAYAALIDTHRGQEA